MPKPRTPFVALACAFLWLVPLAAHSQAASSDKPVRIISAIPPGGSVDQVPLAIGPAAILKCLNEELDGLVRARIAKWAAAVKENGIKAGD